MQRIQSVLRALEGQKKLNPDDESTLKFMRNYESIREKYPPKHYEPSIGDTILFAGDRMILCSRGGTSCDPRYASIGQLKAKGLIEATSDGLMQHKWDGLDSIFESNISNLPEDRVRIKEIRKPTTKPRGIFNRPDILSLPPRLVDKGWMLEDGVYQKIYSHIRGKLDEMDLAGKKILDVGCGQGQLLTWIAREHPEAKIYGVDALESSIKETIKKLKRVGNHDPSGWSAVDRIRQGDAGDLEAVFGRQTFDIIVSTGLITHQVSSPANAKRIIEQWAKHLNDGGIAMTAGFTPIILDPQDFEQTGFTVLQTTEPKKLFTQEEPKEFFKLKKNT